MNQLNKKTYDLEDRTLKFSEAIILFSKRLPSTSITQPLITQLVRCATSIGANYFEANGASSKRDFANKIFICKKEAKETMYWLHLIGKAIEEHVEECRTLWKEAHELTLIFSKIASSSK